MTQGTFDGMEFPPISTPIGGTASIDLEVSVNEAPKPVTDAKGRLVPPGHIYERWWQRTGVRSMAGMTALSMSPYLKWWVLSWFGVAGPFDAVGFASVLQTNYEGWLSAVVFVNATPPNLRKIP